MMNGAESLVRTLLKSDVDVCFTNPGTSEMHFVAALDHVPGMRSVLALFEGVATGAADGYYRMARKPASTLLHLGPGLGNGIANLHNAKKAGSGVVNIVGEHAIDHIALDAPLTADIEGLSWPVSHWVKTSKSAADVGADGAAAVAAALGAPGRIATLILPGDTAWNEGGVVADPVAPDAPATVEAEAVERAAEALSGADTLLLLGGESLTDEGLTLAGKIAAKTGCEILTEWSNARVRRGAGRVSVNRIPYVVELAVDVLKPFRRIVLVGAKPPVAFFAYPDKPGRLTAPEVDFVELAPQESDLVGALDALAQAVGAGAVAPKGVADLAPPAAVEGPNTADSIAAVLGRTIPENGIVVDESVTTGRNFFKATATAAPHDWINNRGGSIGYSLPVAVGAAIACPDRKVLALTGDGSAMYTPQALWTMARENLDVTVVIFSNRTYEILLGELRNVGVQNPGPRAIDMMTLDRPALGWVEMARGMGVDGVKASDAAQLERAILAGLEVEGPFLIDAEM